MQRLTDTAGEAANAASSPAEQPGAPGAGATIVADPEQRCVAHCELVATHRDWIRVFRTLRSTLRYEDLVPLAERLDELLQQFMDASGLFTRRK